MNVSSITAFVKTGLRNTSVNSIFLRTFQTTTTKMVQVSETHS